MEISYSYGYSIQNKSIMLPSFSLMKKLVVFAFKKFLKVILFTYSQIENI